MTRTLRVHSPDGSTFYVYVAGSDDLCTVWCLAAEVLFKLVASVQDGDGVHPWRWSDVLFSATRLQLVLQQERRRRSVL